ncbi:hypothetical protein TIFTF001_008457 [Ficus carica]|uniref:Uncharacterized protein n=1 Tax=Ficus carica TaxID=3494 RepID=A0AA88AF29_FICCA|nr:hypothetical protein TIFTF001_008457 [Ficus carica]
MLPGWMPWMEVASQLFSDRRATSPITGRWVVVGDPSDVKLAVVGRSWVLMKVGGGKLFWCKEMEYNRENRRV